MFLFPACENKLNTAMGRTKLFIIYSMSQQINKTMQVQSSLKNLLKDSVVSPYRVYIKWKYEKPKPIQQQGGQRRSIPLSVMLYYAGGQALRRGSLGSFFNDQRQQKQHVTAGRSHLPCLSVSWWVWWSLGVLLHVLHAAAAAFWKMKWHSATL